ncbi:12567_t:CDS:1, partial [Gigaspora rosea]
QEPPNETKAPNNDDMNLKLLTNGNTIPENDSTDINGISHAIVLVKCALYNTEEMRK